MQSPTVPTNVEKALAFIKLVQNDSTSLALHEASFNGQSLSVTKQQLDAAIRFMEFNQCKYGTITERLTLALEPITIDASKSLYEVFILLHVQTLLGTRTRVFLPGGTSGQKRFMLPYLADSDFVDVPDTVVSGDYGTQIIFDSADIPAAFEALSKAGEDVTSPWRIATCWIQESVKERFLNEYQLYNGKKLAQHDEILKFGGQLFQSERCAVPFVVDITRAHLKVSQQCGENIIFVNFFRTPKEVIGFFNKEKSLCASIWTENCSLANEVASQLMAPTVWINSVGLLDPRIPFIFNRDGTIFGSELSLLQQIAIRRATTALQSNEVDYIEDNTDNYTVFYIVDTHGRKVFFQSTVIPRKSTDKFRVTGQTADWRIRQMVANILFNEQKTIITATGTIFAN